MAIKPINVVITGFDRASHVFGGLSKKAATFGKSMEGISRVSGRLGMGLSGLGVGAAFATGLAAVPGKMMKIEHGLRSLGNVGGLADSELSAIGERLKSISRETNQFQEDLLGGLNTLVAKGMDPKRAVEFLNPIGKAATAAQADVNDLATTTFTVYDNMGVPVNRLGKALDVMAAAGKMGSFELKDMAREFPGLTASAKTLGIQGVEGVAKLGAALQVSMKSAGNTSEAANNFQNFLTKITSTETRKLFMEAGVDLKSVLNRALSEGKDPLEEILEVTRRKTGGDPFKLSFLFRDLQVLTFVKAMTQNMDEYRRMRNESLKADGVIDEDFRKMMETTIEMWDSLKVTMQSMKFGPVAQGITMLNDALAWMNQGDGKNAELVIKGILTAVTLGGGLLAIGSMAGALKDIGIVLGVIANRGPGAIRLLKGLAGIQAVSAASSFAAGSSLGAAGTAAGGAAAGVGAAGKVGLAGALAIPGLLAYGAVRAHQEGMAEGERQFTENRVGRSLTHVNTGFGGVLPVWRNEGSTLKSNPDAIRAAAGRPPEARVSGEITISIPNAPAGTKVATKSQNGVDFKPELGRAY